MSAPTIAVSVALFVLAAPSGPAMTALEALAHLAYGGFWVGVLAVGIDRVPGKAGLAPGAGLKDA